tara:strand:- start:4993 stop:5853 length:861 start_codon:yes stop_codon:yes gene_type:complete
MRKGIILSGGSGTRLYPLTGALSKQSLPIYDKPMIYYAMSVMLLAGIKDILIISSPRDLNIFKEIFKHSKLLGLNIKFIAQKKPNGIAEAFILGEEFIGKDKVSLILGDNIFFGKDFQKILMKISKLNQNYIFSYEVNNPDQYGIIKRDIKKIPKKIIEKPKKFISNEAVTGLYFYTNEVIKIAKKLKPSKRGELEITDINQIFLKKKQMQVYNLGRGFTWFDTGTPDSLLNASSFVKSIQNREPHLIACIEEIAYLKKFTNKRKLNKYLKLIPNSNYKKYIQSIL